MSALRLCPLLVAALCSGLLAAPVRAQHRVALVVGSNAAPPGLSQLRYAHDDARKMRRVLVELGGVAAQDARLLLDPSASALSSALAHLRETGAQRGGHSTLLFYYSGHADSEALQLGRQRLPLAELHAFLKDEGADVRVALLDACHSGALSRSKGGTMRPRIDIRWAPEPGVKGAVLVTSSTAEEASLETDDVGGSLFTHFLVSGLRGAADANQDGAVDLEEAFRYAYGHTLERSAGTRSGAQHPTFDLRISGQRQLVLTRTRQPAAMRFGEQLAGTYLVYDRARSAVVAELAKPPGERRTLWLPPGDYYVKKRLPAAILLQKVRLARHSEHEVHDHAMHTVPYEEDVTKGRLSDTFLPTWRYGAPFIHETAHTLRRGELSLGIVHTSVGLSDSVTLSTVLLGDLLASPNGMLKVRLWRNESLVWSLHSGFMTSFIGPLLGEERSAIGLQVGSTLSWVVSPSLTLSALASWHIESDSDLPPEGSEQGEVEWEVQQLRAGVSVTWAFLERDLLQLVLRGESTVWAPSGTSGVGTLDWGGRALYAHNWGVFRLGAGVAREAFVSETLHVDTLWTPWLDLWWRW